ncbi:hypothetical protein VSK91_19765 [Bacillus swezeyi]|uniref:hypothetical protein n=1 Tax=Bacillus swezeyi TaxID=1925020 RepID=UPI002E1C7AC2|nr:hypothetical protein [Bacillus swezeyi]MED2979633.1 hypothetical protein [Bacillus swezeyi]
MVILSLNVNKFLLLDEKLKPELLDYNCAILAEIEGRTVLLKEVDVNDIIKQIEEQKNVQPTPRRDWFDINDMSQYR